MPKDVDLTGAYRMDLKTLAVLLALGAQWWDGRAQAQRQAELQQIRDTATRETLAEMKRLQQLQQYDVNNIILALAEAGINVKKGE